MFEVLSDTLRRILPYTTAAVVIAGIYAGVTMYSRYRDARDVEREFKDKQAVVNQKIVDMYGGDRLTILTFAGSPGVVSAGGVVRLCYGVSNATSVRIEPDVPPIKPAITHCVEVHPQKTTEYTLSAEDGKGNHKEESLTVRVR